MVKLTKEMVKKTKLPRQYFFVFESTRINTLLYLFLNIISFINDEF